jgi:hypothetical protein
MAQLIGANPKAKYVYTGPTQTHMATDDQGQRVFLDPGDEVELTLEQYNAFKDRFAEPKTRAAKAVQTEADPKVTPVPQTGTGNLIPETDRVIDPGAGDNAFQSASQVTAESAAAAVGKTAKPADQPLPSSSPANTLKEPAKK